MSYIVFLSTKGLQMVQGNVSKNNIHISSPTKILLVNFIFLLTKNLNLLKEQC